MEGSNGREAQDEALLELKTAIAAAPTGKEKTLLMVLQKMLQQIDRKDKQIDALIAIIRKDSDTPATNGNTATEKMQREMEQDLNDQQIDEIIAAQVAAADAQAAAADADHERAVAIRAAVAAQTAEIKELVKSVKKGIQE